MRSVNKVILIGNLTRDPELKNTPNGQAVVTFGLATNREWTTSEKERKSLAEFHSVVAWGKLAEICQQFLTKGRYIYIEGYLKTRSWDNENGTKSFRTEVVATDMIILDKERRSNGDSSHETAKSSDDDFVNDAEQQALQSDDGGLDNLL